MSLALKIENGSGRPADTRVTDLQSGAEVRGIRALDVHYRPDMPVAAELHLMTMAEPSWRGPVLQTGKAVAKVYVVDPVTGQPREARAIEWADGGRTQL